MEYSKEFTVLYNEGRFYYNKNDFNRAIFKFKKLIELDKEFSFGYFYIGSSYLLINNHDEALKYLQLGLGENSILTKPYLKVSHSNIGLIYYKRKQLGCAIRAAKRALKFDETDYANNLNLYIYYSKLKRWSEAIEYASICVELKRHSASALNYRAFCFQNLEKYELAIADYANAISIDKRDLNSRLNKGICFSRLERYPEALKEFDEIIKLGFKSLKAFLDRGYTYYNLEKYDLALLDLNMCIQMDKKYWRAYAQRALVFNSIGKFQNGLNDSEMAIALNSIIDRSSFYNRGVSHYGMNNFINAFSDFSIFLYCCMKDGNVSMVSSMIKYFSNSYPYNVYTILSNFEIDKYNSITTPFENPLAQIKDFQDYINHVVSANSNNSFSKELKSILHFYLGGTVDAYIRFEEEIDTLGEKYSARGLYYYFRSAEYVNLKKVAILNSCIENCPKGNSIDLYYLGHLHLKNNQVYKALSYFEKSKGFVFSEIMFSYLLKQVNTDPDVQLDNFDYSIIANSSIISLTDLSQFDTYFYMSECSAAINYLNIEFNLNIPYARCQIWEMYSLTAADRDFIKIEENRIKSLKLLGDIKNELLCSLEKMDKKTTEQLKEILQEANSAHISEMFIRLNLRSTDESNFENQLGLVIGEWTPPNPKLYLYIIQYHYIKNNLSDEETFNLFLYTIKTFHEKNKSKLAESLTLLFNSILDVTKIIASDLALNIFVVLFKNSKAYINTIFNDLDDFCLQSKSDYMGFREELWKHIFIDKNTLSEKDFNQKYRVFKWFNGF